jgi:amidase
VGPVAGFGWASAVQVAEAIRSRQVSAAEVLAEQLERIARLDAELGAVVTLDAEGARRRAAEADRALARGEVWGPLHGVGVTIEDIHATAGIRSTFGGYRPFASFVPDTDATVAARLKAAGAIVVGKTNGPCLWGQDSVFGPTRNPWNPARTAGGLLDGPGRGGGRGPDAAGHRGRYRRVDPVPGRVLRGVRDAPDRAPGAVDRHVVHRPGP